MLIPYILFELLGYLVQCFTGGFYENLNGFIFRVATFQVHTDVDWFLIGLFFGEIVFYFARKNKYIAIAAWDAHTDDTDPLAGDFQRKDSVLDWKLWVISECSCF